MTRVLLIEDNLSVLESTALELELRGYEVMQATDGIIALDRMKTAPLPPDIIVSDIAMPNMDGYQLLEMVQKNEAWKGIPFIYLTAFSSPNAVRLGKELGVDDYLVKPFMPEDLVVAIENKLKRVAQFRTDAAKQVDQARQALLMMISHELRTPLTTIYGGAEMLAESIEALPDEMSHHLLGLVRMGAKRMNRLVNQILIMVQIDSGQIEQYIQKNSRLCDIGSIVLQAWQNTLAEMQLDENQVRVVLQLPDTPVWVRGMQEHLITAVSEVCRNALTFGSPDANIVLNVRVEGSHAVISVTDKGDGISPAGLPHVWERFTQVDREQQEQQGAGLGLAIVRELIRLHSGSSDIESAQGKGTTVTLRLPLSKERPTGDED